MTSWVKVRLLSRPWLGLRSCLGLKACFVLWTCLGLWACFILWITVLLAVSDQAHAEEVRFSYGDHQLLGHYLAPTDAQPVRAVLVFVHGDGAMNYDASGFFELIWTPLRAQGYAIFSWDKPGVGGSSGNWLSLTMADRQGIAISAIETLQRRYGFPTAQIGFVGFSQAGWVVPELLAEDSLVSFAVGIGFATDWVAQGQYLTARRRQLSGASPEEIKAAVARYDREIEFFASHPSYDDYLEFFHHFESFGKTGVLTSRRTPMSRERYHFVLNNYLANASNAYQKLHRPTLLLWGDTDFNVDAYQELSDWQRRAHPLVTTRMIENATHAMLRADVFGEPEFGLKAWLKLMWMEEDALAPGFLPVLIKWLNERTQQRIAEVANKP